MKYASKIFRPLILTPKDAIIKHQTSKCKSQRLMIELGVMRPSASMGIYSLLPVGMRSLNKLIHLVDSVMESIEAQKISLPNLVSESLWIKSSRLNAELELMKIKDRDDKCHILAPTHEEAVTDLIAHISPVSHKNLPLKLYQIGNKFRDEMRPRYGLIRSREFLMKDLYTFDVDEETSIQTYKLVNAAYENIFNTIGVDYIKVDGHTGNIGGSISHEFHFTSPIGDDILLDCKNCNHRTSKELLLSKDNSTEDLECPNCKHKDFGKTSGFEVGHTFLLGDKYTKPLDAFSVGSSPLQMGCYGLGLTRIIGAALESLSTETDLRWPFVLAPYTVCMIGPKKGSKEESSSSHLVEELYSSITKSCPSLLDDIVVDDRSSLTIGRRVMDSKRLGFPYIIIVGTKATQESPEYELIDVYKDEVFYFSQEALIEKIQDVVADNFKKLKNIHYMENYIISSDVLNENSLK